MVVFPIYFGLRVLSSFEILHPILADRLRWCRRHQNELLWGLRKLMAPFLGVGRDSLNLEGIYSAAFFFLRLPRSVLVWHISVVLVWSVSTWNVLAVK